MTMMKIVAVAEITQILMNTNMNMNITELETRTPHELRDIARDWDMSGYSTLSKEDLIFQLLQAAADRQGPG